MLSSLAWMDRSALGLTEAEIADALVLRERPDHAVYRITRTEQTYVLKVFTTTTPALEVKMYSLLHKYGVPTLPVYRQTSQALLLEDLKHSKAWRLATQSDLDRVETGVAVADWYHKLHECGYRVLKRSTAQSLSVSAWVDEIDEKSIFAAADRFGFRDVFDWNYISEQLEQLKRMYLAIPQTFNYNDFALENLALSHDANSPLRAIVFDYDQFSIGTACSDWRNVVGSLRGPSQAGFIETYGPVSEIDKAVDEPLSVMYALIVASRRISIPKWATPLVQWIREGNLDRSLDHAMQL